MLIQIVQVIAEGEAGIRRYSGNNSHTIKMFLGILGEKLIVFIVNVAKFFLLLLNAFEFLFLKY